MSAAEDPATPPDRHDGPAKKEEDDNLTEAERNLKLHENEDSPPIYKFVFTGGPCGGKTTALARVFSFLRERNFAAISCPEA